MTKEHVDLEGFIKGVERRNPASRNSSRPCRKSREDIFDFIQDKQDYHEYADPAPHRRA